MIGTLLMVWMLGVSLPDAPVTSPQFAQDIRGHEEIHVLDRTAPTVPRASTLTITLAIFLVGVAAMAGSGWIRRKSVFEDNHHRFEATLQAQENAQT